MSRRLNHMRQIDPMPHDAWIEQITAEAERKARTTSAYLGYLQTPDYNDAEADRLRALIDKAEADAEYCACGGYRMPENEYCKDCI